MARITSLPGIASLNMAIKKNTEGQVKGNGRAIVEDSNRGRISVAKTYKMYIGGQFVRTESGRYKPITLADGTCVNLCRASRKDLRNAVVAARKVQQGWMSRTAYNRSQILYRMAEMLEGRKAQMAGEMIQLGITAELASASLSRCVDRAVYYAGWCDKYQQLFSTVNPVAAAYFNFSVPEPMGVVVIICHDTLGIEGLVSELLPAIAGGNTCVVLSSETQPTTAVTFAEILHTSDLPGGVVNILTGNRDELLNHIAMHRDINAVVYAAESDDQWKRLQTLGADFILRTIDHRPGQLKSEQGPYHIMDLQEIKTTWHPIGL